MVEIARSIAFDLATSQQRTRAMSGKTDLARQTPIHQETAWEELREARLLASSKKFPGLIVAVLPMLVGTGAAAATSSKIETAGQAVAISLPLVAGGISLLHDDDWDGVAELSASTVLTVGTSYLLTKLVHERRPDHSDFHSFPSNTAALAYAPADYLWARYGWEYGVPAYLAASFVGFSRVDAKRHHWYDVAASSAIAFGVNYAIVTRYHANNRYSLYASADPTFTGVHFAMNW